MYTRIHILAAAAVGAVAGAAMGYIFAQKQLEKKYSEQFENEITVAKQYGAMIKKDGEFASPVSAAEALGVTPNVNVDAAAEKLIQSLGYRGDKSAEVSTPVRNRKKPYLLREDEYMENETGFDQVTLTYFKGDDVVCDEADNVVEDVDAIIGKANLDCFGQISGDDNIVYVRNEKLKTEYEVILDQREYAEVVAGLKEA